MANSPSIRIRKKTPSTSSNGHGNDDKDVENGTNGTHKKHRDKLKIVRYDTQLCRYYNRHTSKVVMLLALITIVYCITYFDLFSSSNRIHQMFHPPKQLYYIDDNKDAIPITIPLFDNNRTEHRFVRPSTILNADYGGIDYTPVRVYGKGRIIKLDDDAERGHVYTSEDFKDGNDDYVSSYYAFDDDARNRGRFRKHEDAYYENCRRLSWQRLRHQSCNQMHEQPVVEYRYVGHGTYRDAWVTLEPPHVVIKTARYPKEGEEDKKYYQVYEFIRMDAIVMERLTSSPRIVDVYGYCGTSVLTEHLVRELEDITVPGSGHLKTHKLNDEKDVDPQNDFTPAQKLNIALEMAEAIADLHGFQDGLIVHDDIQLAQYLWNEKGRLVLNDFNRAEIMQWDDHSGSYCKYRNGGGYGSYRAPEEFADNPLDEKIDVFSFGNNVYALLTGLWNFYGETDDGVVQKKIINGDTGYIDERYRTRSYAEASLVKIIDKCWVHNPEDRIDIFSVVEYLKAAIKRNNDLIASVEEK